MEIVRVFQMIDPSRSLRREIAFLMNMKPQLAAGSDKIRELLEEFKTSTSQVYLCLFVNLYLIH